MSASSWLPWVFLNGRMLPAGEAKVSPLGDGFMFGWGVFETLGVVRGRPAFFEEHAARLARTAAELALPEAGRREGLRDRCGRVLAANRLDEGSLKIVWFRDGEGETENSGELILARGPSYAPEIYAHGFALRTVPAGDLKGARASLKTLNYLRPIAERRRALAAGWDDALWVGPEGEVLEGSAANLFAVERGGLVTPAVDGRILPGVARARVLALARAAAIPVEEGRLELRRLRAADEVFVTNALVGVMPVARVDECRYDLSANSVTRRLRAALARAQGES